MTGGLLVLGCCCSAGSAWLIPWVACPWESPPPPHARSSPSSKLEKPFVMPVPKTESTASMKSSSRRLTASRSSSISSAANFADVLSLLPLSTASNELP
eukprot:240341-Chlamydomonas_euryale.AAC.17